MTTRCTRISDIEPRLLDVFQHVTKIRVFETPCVLMLFLGQGHEVRVSLGGQGRGHRVDISTKRAGVHDASTVHLRLDCLSGDNNGAVEISD